MYGIKLILVPTNFEDSFGGMHWWVRTFKGPNHPKEDFYRDPKIQRLFRQYLSALANRVNSKNGRKYREDPTIMAWNTMNEPHTKDGVDPTGQLAAKYICSIFEERFKSSSNDGFGRRGLQDQGRYDWHFQRTRMGAEWAQRRGF
jgi:mannan endo-1,4-beta-mannosidase